MKTILKFAALLLVLVGSLGSCKETVTESLDIFVKNRTDSAICIKLYPKAAYRDGLLYRSSDIGSGFRDTEFIIPIDDDNMYNWDGQLFESGNLNIEPYALAAEIFDSIYISTANKERVIIKFTHDNVTGYSENIFSEHSTWDFEIVERDMSDFRKRTNRAYQHRFLILKDKITHKSIINSE